MDHQPASADSFSPASLTSTPSPSPLPHSPKLLLPLLVIGVLFFLGSAVFFAYRYYQLKQQLVIPSPTLLTQASPSPAIVLADWKTYSSPHTSLTFQYPPTYDLTDNDPHPNESGYWQIQLTSPLTQHAAKDTAFNQQELRVELYIAPNTPPQTLTQFYASNNQPDGNPPSQPENTTVGGAAAIKTKWVGMGTGISYYFIQDNHQYILTKYPQQSDRDQEFEQILSTIKFSASNASPSPSPKSTGLTYAPSKEWQTVANPAVGVSVCLPPQWAFDTNGDGSFSGYISFTRDPQYKAGATAVLAYPYNGGSRREEYINLKTQYEGGPEAFAGKIKVTDVTINGKSFLEIAIPSFPTVLLTAVGNKMYTIDSSYQPLVDDSKTHFQANIYTIAGCLKPL